MCVLWQASSIMWNYVGLNYDVKRELNGRPVPKQERGTGQCPSRSEAPRLCHRSVRTSYTSTTGRTQNAHRGKNFCLHKRSSTQSTQIRVLATKDATKDAVAGAVVSKLNTSITMATRAERDKYSAVLQRPEGMEGMAISYN